MMSKWSKAFQTFCLHSSVFALKKAPKNINFRASFTSNIFFGGTSNETRAPTSGKYVGEKGIVMSNWSKWFQTSWSHSSVCALEKEPKI